MSLITSVLIGVVMLALCVLSFVKGWERGFEAGRLKHLPQEPRRD